VNTASLEPEALILADGKAGHTALGLRDERLRSWKFRFGAGADRGAKRPTAVRSPVGIASRRLLTSNLLRPNRNLAPPNEGLIRAAIAHRFGAPMVLAVASRLQVLLGLGASRVVACEAPAQIVVRK
jgi:hypothetical protein